ncbi:MAG: hypothetical protein L0K41_00985 [Yaniella sp.]|uniref:hypothetical protein n=1 Tax=Yaniella sp. TaxID=2773929 RepID=UPI002649296E|nr:hypothetical protein [Yaniella sp.]MDN5704068.1 hypothetical protein [Yaniella sp.]MDN5731758.1 hypothetical protein [Yaniella sp.]MDN5815604.1 hypothetical protein [Yaniella sp.]MDN5818275.1 hypothetical protein [Yaniella sp.]MDN5838742.1 hypothetical protein [Yaniella sp.]
MSPGNDLSGLPCARPANTPGASEVLLMLPFVVWSEVLGTWAVLFIVVTAIPTAVLDVRHIRHVQRSFL